jgi:hypothetical protein
VKEVLTWSLSRYLPRHRYTQRRRRWRTTRSIAFGDRKGTAGGDNHPRRYRACY